MYMHRWQKYQLGALGKEELGMMIKVLLVQRCVSRSSYALLAAPEYQVLGRDTEKENNLTYDAWLEQPDTRDNRSRDDAQEGIDSV